MLSLGAKNIGLWCHQARPLHIEFRSQAAHQLAGQGQGSTTGETLNIYDFGLLLSTYDSNHQGRYSHNETDAWPIAHYLM